MTSDQVTYLVFGIVLLLALIFDLGLLSKKSQKITIRQALYQTFFWVGLALAFFIFMWLEKWTNHCTGIPERLPDGVEPEH